jgi:hypothetical protein
MRLAEMLLPSKISTGWPAAGRTGLGQAQGPRYTDVNGQPISSIVCGGTYSFDVPGHNHVYLIQVKNGQEIWRGSFPLPMSKYTSTCANDVGAYVSTVYDLTTGQNLGSASMNVLAADGTTSPPPGAPPGGPLPGVSPIATWFSNLSSTSILVIAAGILFLMGGKKGQK